MLFRSVSQSRYEVYLITSDDGISESDIRDMFEADPQGSADTVRRVGIKLYDDRPSQKQLIS